MDQQQSQQTNFCIDMNKSNSLAQSLFATYMAELQTAAHPGVDCPEEVRNAFELAFFSGMRVAMALLDNGITGCLALEKVEQEVDREKLGLNIEIHFGK